MMPAPRTGAPRVGVFHPGTQHSWQTALAFQEAGRLGWYATSIFYDPARWPYRVERLLPQRLADKAHRRFTRRHTPALRPELVRQAELWEWIETAAASLGRPRLAGWANAVGNRRFGRYVAALAEREPIDILWGYDTSSLEAFRWAKRRGIYCVLDRTIGHGAEANRVLAAEYARHPDFFPAPFTPKPASVIAEEDEEIALADLVVVGSAYCADTLVAHGCPRAKIRVVPYGYDEQAFPDEAPLRARRPGAPLECLFVGNVGARKGVAYLLEAFARIDAEAARLTMVGGLSIPAEAFAPYRARVRHVASLPRPEVVRHFRDADCLILPSLFEGSAVVLKESYGAGLAALHTAAAGDGVVTGRNGAILGPASVDDIVREVEALAGDRARLASWQRESWAMRGGHSWRQYRARVRALVDAAA